MNKCCSLFIDNEHFAPLVVLLVFALVMAGCDSATAPPDDNAPGSQAQPQNMPGAPGDRVEKDVPTADWTNGRTPQDLAHAMEVQDRRTPELMRNPDIVGTGVRLTDTGKPKIVIYTEMAHTGPAATASVPAKLKASLPSTMDGVPVTFEATGSFSTGAVETSRRRPAPLGFSVGHPEITAGTIGARVTDDAGNVYILSNNHVLANTNEASVGDDILQPGPADGGTNPADAIGTLSDYEPYDFSGNNTMDAAIANVSSSDLSDATSNEGYGTPSSTPYTLDNDGDGNVDAGVVGLGVQKYGRTTGLTNGEIAEVNVTVNICYDPAPGGGCNGSTTFVDQLSISSSSGSFSDGGDSGSLIVTDDGNKNPVGLLFAGGGGRTLANPIQPVLDRFGVTIDGGDGGGGDPPPPDEEPCSDCTLYTGSLSDGGYEFQPDGNYYESPAGAQNGYLRGPSSADFDLRLWKYDYFGWTTVASSTSTNSSEDINYSGSSGYYTWRIESYSGSGSYDFYLDRP